VITRTSVMQYKGTGKGIAEIRRELQAGTILEGSVRKAGDRLRITAQLMDVESQGHLWSHPSTFWLFENSLNQTLRHNVHVALPTLASGQRR
jgi:TolB-like protein